METARDVSIILLAIFAIIQAVLIIAVCAATFILIRTIQKKVIPLLDRVPPIVDRVPVLMDTAQGAASSIEKSARQVQTTTVFATDKAAKPVIKIASFLSGARATAIGLGEVFSGRWKK